MLASVIFRSIYNLKATFNYDYSTPSLTPAFPPFPYIPPLLLPASQVFMQASVHILSSSIQKSESPFQFTDL